MAKHEDPWIICPVCDGDGRVVNPNIDAHGLTAEDFDEDPDFAEDYASGLYDIPCTPCDGTGKLRQSKVAQLEENAEARRLAAREDGDFEAWNTAGDYRYG